MQPGVPQDEDGKRRLVLKLITRLRCPSCSRLYSPEDFALLHRWPDAWVLSAHCRHCDSSSHVVVFLTADARAGTLGDLTAEESRSWGEQPPISADDVLDIHALLQGFEGDFDSLLSP